LWSVKAKPVEMPRPEISKMPVEMPLTRNLDDACVEMPLPRNLDDACCDDALPRNLNDACC
jgi:hypothetical protein